MKRILRQVVVATSCCFALVLSARAASNQGFYIDAGLGGTIADDVKLREFITPTPGAKLRLTPGARLSVAPGYNFNEYLGAQLETGIMENDVRHVDAWVGHVPLMADVVLRCDRADCRWVPYVGVGAGGDVSIITLDKVRTAGGVVDGSGSDVVFALQAFAGVRYRLTDSMSVGGGYKFYWADGATWDVQHSAGSIKVGEAEVHSFSLEFEYRF